MNSKTKLSTGSRLEGSPIPSAFFGPSVDCRGVSRNDDPARRELGAALKRVGELESAARALVAKMLDVAKPEGMGRAVVYGELWREHRALESLLAKEPGE